MRTDAICVLLAIGISAGEIIDRIAVTFGKDVITESEIIREIRMTDFLNEEKLTINPETKRKAAERLIEQKLMRRELKLGRYPAPEEGELDQLLQQVKSNRFGNEAQYRSDLKLYDISEKDLSAHLLWQLTALRFIDLRFRPGIRVTQEEVREYYETRLPEIKKTHAGKDTDFEDVREEIEQKLVAERVDQQLDEWLKETRKRTPVKFREEVFR